MIKSFADKATAAVFRREFVRGLPLDIQRRGYVKLLLIHAATRLDTLAVPPGNRLEALGGNRKGQHAIRINDQWRLCFIWRDGNAYDVEIVDYH